MKKATYNWQVNPQEVPADFKTELKNQGYSEAFIQLVWSRGIHDSKTLQHFLTASIDDLHDPFLIHDMERAVNRIQQAIVNDEMILVYGDYDADGITSTAILVETLEMLGANVGYVLPNRFIHGYGPNQELFAEKIAEGYQLIVTVDNGVAGNDAIAFANTQGVDVIVTDHHELPPELPEALAIVHPRHPAGQYPFGELAGAGVAFKVACALLEEVPFELLDLACLGTVADLVSLTDENRTIVQLGLGVIKQNQRVGLNQLLAVSGVDLQKVDETAIGFSLAPRLNAIGRLGDPNPAVELLTTFDEERAFQLATELNTINEERKQLVKQTTKEALALIEPDAAFQLIAKADWNPGILGIVAGNVVKQTGQPAVVLTIDSTTGQAKGSGRSVEGINLFAVLGEFRDQFTHFGGHAAAVGLTLPVANLETVQQQVNTYLHEHQLTQYSGTNLMIDGKLALKDASLALVEELKQLAPFGTDNPAPHFLFDAAELTEMRKLGAEQQHLKFCLVDDQHTKLDVIAFNFGEVAEELQQTDTQFVGDLDINEWNGHRKVQLQLIDFKVEGLQVIDRRAKYSWQQALEAGKTVYLAFDPASKKILPPEKRAAVVTYDNTPELIEELVDCEQLVVLDCPAERAVLKELVSTSSLKRIYLFLYSREEAYLNGMASQRQFAALYKFFQKYPRVDVRYKLKNISNFLRISENLLVFMIHVFSDLKFVTIEDGVLQLVEQPANRSIEESHVYQKRLHQIESEKFLLLSDIKTIRNWLKD